MTEPSLILRATRRSGHAHRVELLLHMLDLSYVYREALAA